MLKKSLLILVCLFAFGLPMHAAPTITVSGNSVSILGSAQTISLTCTLIDPNNTGMLRVGGTQIITVFVTNTVTPGTTATCGPVYGNDVITDGFGNVNSTYYKIQVFTVDSSGVIASTPSLQNFYAFTGSGTVDLATATPLAPSYFSSATGSVSVPGNFSVSGNMAGPFAFTGLIALPNTTSSSVGVITFGGARFIHNFGNANTFVGSSAGNFTTSGQLNSGFGFNVLQPLTTGNSNSAFGQGAMAANTSGGGNVAVGDSALAANTTGFSNTAIGHFALKSNTTGQNNSAFGTAAMQSLVGGTTTNNSAFGAAALLNVTTGTNNNGFGVDALRNITTGSNNMAFGVAPGAGPGAAYASSESNNIVIGNVGIVGESNVIRIGTGGTHLSTFLSGAVFMPQIGNAAGLQLFNTTTTCTTGTAVGATCTTAVITLPAPETDTAYRIVCTGKGLTNVPVVIATTNSSATQFTITIAALTAAAASFASYDCTAGHN